LIIIGDRTVLLSETVLCPKAETLGLHVSIPGEDDPWKIVIKFTETESNPDRKGSKASPSISWVVENDVWRIDFSNWSSALGATLSDPAEIAVSIHGQTLTLLAEVAKLTNIYRANIQIMIEGKVND